MDREKTGSRGCDGILIQNDKSFPCYNIVVKENIQTERIKNISGEIHGQLIRNIEKKIYFRSTINIFNIVSRGEIIYFQIPTESEFRELPTAKAIGLLLNILRTLIKARTGPKRFILSELSLFYF